MTREEKLNCLIRVRKSLNGRCSNSRQTCPAVIRRQLHKPCHASLPESIPGLFTTKNEKITRKIFLQTHWVCSYCYDNFKTLFQTYPSKDRSYYNPCPCHYCVGEEVLLHLDYLIANPLEIV